MSNLKLGDVVCLKAGGLDMTVYTINGNDIGCKWFDGNELKFGGFIIQELEII